ncbi:hypothetical protein FIBSPDRAFT_1041305 [Athelia psychrophila]|uniref:Uncharacterized protein n=1 Tax=Athelia psychrophila TaxID=1759441 RepID=A0A166P4K6_9AGAM|nr:hypothetical protein FIBSPDRAFT_1041305 [Fibularhizoctonia sp. CBS 109695]
MSDIMKRSGSAATPTRTVTNAAASAAMWGVYTPRKSFEHSSQPLSRMSAVSLSTPKFSAADPLNIAIYNSASPHTTKNIAQADIKQQPGQQMSYRDTVMGALMPEIHRQKSRRLPFLARNVRRGFALVCHELGVPIEKLPGESSTKLHVIMRSIPIASGSISEEGGSANRIIQRYSLPFLQCPLCHLHKKFANSIMLRRHIEWDHPDIGTKWSKTTAGGGLKLRITINATFPEYLPAPWQISPRNALLGAADGGLESAPDLHSVQSSWEDVPLVTSMSQINITNEISASTAGDAFPPRLRASSHEFSPSPSRSSSSGSLYHQPISRKSVASADAIARRRQSGRPVLSELQKRKSRSGRMKNQRRPPPRNAKERRQRSNHCSQQGLSISDDDEDASAILNMLDGAAEAGVAIAANDSPRSLSHASISSEHPMRTPELAHQGSPNFINREVLSSVLALDARSPSRLSQVQNPPHTPERSHNGSPDSLNQDWRLPMLALAARSTPRLSQPSSAGIVPHEPPIEGRHSAPKPAQSTPAGRLGDGGAHAYTAPTDDGNPLVARRPGGPRIYDAVNAAPLTQFGMLSWFILEREEEMFELHDICDEDKVLQALWGRWALLNRLAFGYDYYAGTLRFIEDNWMTIHQAADWVTLRAFLLTFVINRFLTGQEVAKLLKHYNTLVEADYG